jgi:hypothetical protein
VVSRFKRTRGQWGCAYGSRRCCCCSLGMAGLIAA